jgi:preprotein translocase subunit SecE
VHDPYDSTTTDHRSVDDGHHQRGERGAVSDEKPAREGDPRAASGAEPTDEQLDREAPGVDDAAELEAAEAELAAEAESDEDKVVAARPTGTRRGGRITAGDDEDDETAPRSRRAARERTPSRPAGRHAEGGPTRSRAAAERDRAAEARQRRSLRRFLREVVAELRKVIWPGRRELITYTTVVIVFVAFIVALVAGLDLLFAQGVLAVFG